MFNTPPPERGVEGGLLPGVHAPALRALVAAVEGLHPQVVGQVADGHGARRP